MNLLWCLLLLIALVSGWLMVLVGLPGTWLMVVAAALYAWLVPPESMLAFSWQVAAALLIMALLAEALELAAGAMGAARAGGSRRSALLAIVGSIVGGITGAVVGVPIPVIGSLVAALLFAGVGAFVGALLGEQWKGRDLQTSVQVGKAAFWGRLFGSLLKLAIATVMVLVATAAVLF